MNLLDLPAEIRRNILFYILPTPEKARTVQVCPCLSCPRRANQIRCDCFGIHGPKLTYDSWETHRSMRCRLLVRGIRENPERPNFIYHPGVPSVLLVCQTINDDAQQMLATSHHLGLRLRVCSLPCVETFLLGSTPATRNRITKVTVEQRISVPVSLMTTTQPGIFNVKRLRHLCFTIGGALQLFYPHVSTATIELTDDEFKIMGGEDRFKRTFEVASMKHDKANEYELGLSSNTRSHRVAVLHEAARKQAEEDAFMRWDKVYLINGPASEVPEY